MISDSFGNMRLLTRGEIRALFKYPEFNFSKYYNGALSIILITSFYATLIPISIVYAIISLVIYYWVAKVII